MAKGNGSYVPVETPHPRIFWTVQEMIRLIRVTPDILTTTDHIALAKLLTLAQLRALDTDRHREYSSLRSALRDSDRLRAIIEEARQVIALSTPAAPPPAPPAAAALTPEPVAAAAAALTPEPVHRLPIAHDTLHTRMHELVDDFAVTLGHTLEGVLQRSFEQSLMEFLPRILATHNEQVHEQVRSTLLELLGPSTGSVESLPPARFVTSGTYVSDEPTPDEPQPTYRIDVVGLLGKQEEIVKRHAPKDVMLRFIKTDDIKSIPIKGTHAIMATKFVSHVAQNRIRQSGAELVFANGGIESVLGAIEQIRTAAH